MSDELRKLVELELYESYSRYGGAIPGKILENTKFLDLPEIMTKIIGYILDLDIECILPFKFEAARTIRFTYVKYYIFHKIRNYLPSEIKEAWELYEEYEDDIDKFINVISVCKLRHDSMIILLRSMIHVYDVSLRLSSSDVFVIRREWVSDVEIDTCYEMMSDMERLFNVPKIANRYLLKLIDRYTLKSDVSSDYKLLNRLKKSKSMWSLRTVNSTKSTLSLRTIDFRDGGISFIENRKGELKLNLSLKSINVVEYRDVLRKLFVKLLLDVIKYYKLRYYYDYVKNESLKYSKLKVAIRFKCDYDVKLIKKILIFINYTD